MHYRLHKFIIQPILLQHDEKGEPIREVRAEPVEVFSTGKLVDYATDFGEELTNLNAQELVVDGD